MTARDSFLLCVWHWDSVTLSQGSSWIFLPFVPWLNKAISFTVMHKSINAFDGVKNDFEFQSNWPMAYHRKQKIFAKLTWRDKVLGLVEFVKPRLRVLRAVSFEHEEALRSSQMNHFVPLICRTNFYFCLRIYRRHLFELEYALRRLRPKHHA